MEFLNTEAFTFKDGIYYSAASTKLSFPEEGLSELFEIEEKSFWHQHRKSCILSLINSFSPNGIIADVGGGNGLIAKALQGEGYDIVLFEPDAKGISDAKARGVKKLVCGLFHKETVQENSVGGVILFDVLEHIENDLMFLADMNKLIKDGGMLYISVPAHNFLWSSKDDYTKHYRRYTLKDLGEKIENSGYEVCYSSYYFSILMLPMILLKSIPYRIFRHRKIKSHQYFNEHKQFKKAAVVKPFLNKELRDLHKLKSKKIGASCILVARVIKKQQTGDSQ